MKFTVTCETCPRVHGWPITWIFEDPDKRDRWADWHMVREHSIQTTESDGDR